MVPRQNPGYHCKAVSDIAVKISTAVQPLNILLKIKSKNNENQKIMFMLTKFILKQIKTL